MTQNPYASFTTSENLEINGLWLEEPLYRVKVARSGGKNKNFQKALESSFRPHRRSVKLGTISDEVATPLLVDVYIQTVIKGWQVATGEKDEAGDIVYSEGIHDPETGDVLPVTPENIKRVLLNERFGKALFDYIQEQAGNVSLFLEDVTAVDSKN